MLPNTGLNWTILSLCNDWHVFRCKVAVFLFGKVIFSYLDLPDLYFVWCQVGFFGSFLGTNFRKEWGFMKLYLSYWWGFMALIPYELGQVILHHPISRCNHPVPWCFFSPNTSLHWPLLTPRGGSHCAGFVATGDLRRAGSQCWKRNGQKDMRAVLGRSTPHHIYLN